MTQVQELLARKYALAFVNLTDHQLTPDSIARIKQLRQYLQEHTRIVFYLSLSLIKLSVKDEAIGGLIKQFRLDEHKLDEQMRLLLELLIQEHRVALFPSILSYIVRLYQKRRGIMQFKFCASHVLTAAQLELIEQFIARLAGRAIIYDYAVDTKLIAGIRLQSTTLLWEHSIAKQLHAVHVSLIR